ncbi:MAG: hypothetical protein JRJ85_14535 [Deltaproteobacteria bacterium]|nr:hypothetical protein [Deltaproteobacteria bacterium]
MSTGILLFMMVAGCGTMSDYMKSHKFENTSDNFRLTMRWSTLEAAMSFMKDTRSVRDSSEIDMLKRIKITSCEISRITYLENKTKVRQVIGIQYYKIDDPVVRTLTANLLWEYDAIQENWTIIDGWPTFK